MASRYAAIAESNWQQAAPKAYAAIKDKPAFFEALAAEAQRQIDQAVEQSTPVEGETFPQRASRLAQAQAAAEEVVSRELLTPPPEAEETLDPTGGIPLPEPETPEDRELREALTDFQDAAREYEQQRVTATS